MYLALYIVSRREDILCRLKLTITDNCADFEDFFQLAQSKLVENGFAVLDEAMISQAAEQLSTPSSSPPPLHSLLIEALTRVAEVLEQYGRRGQLVQELILSAETAARRNERLATDNKELALQIADLTHNTRAPDPAKMSPLRNNGEAAQRLEAQLKDATTAERRTNEQLAQMHEQLLDTRQDLAVSLKREAGLSAELRRVQQEGEMERQVDIRSLSISFVV